eukprot:NODE_223_length_13915_cov_0.128257.p5 type:complete len:357 gc:universal NODE_223_length_13915_cov_0.128257:5250-6320(+)
MLGWKDIVNNSSITEDKRSSFICKYCEFKAPYHKEIVIPHCATCVKSPKEMRSSFCDEIDEVCPGILEKYNNNLLNTKRLNHKWENIVTSHVIVSNNLFTCLLCEVTDVYTKNSVILHFSNCSSEKTQILEQINNDLIEFGSEKLLNISCGLQELKTYSWKSICLKYGIFSESNFICMMCIPGKVQNVPTPNKSGVVRHLLSCSGMSPFLDDFMILMEDYGDGASQYLKYISPSKNDPGRKNIKYHKNLIGAKPVPNAYKKTLELGRLGESAAISMDKPVYKAYNENWVQLGIHYGVFYLEKCRFLCGKCSKYIYHDRKIVLRHLCICITDEQEHKKLIRKIKQFCPKLVTKFDLE